MSIVSASAPQPVERPTLSLVRKLREISDGVVQTDVKLSDFSRWRIGGPADVIVQPGSVEGVHHCMRVLHNTGLPLIVIGDGSNILFDDAGFRGVVIKIGRFLSHLRIDGLNVSAQAGLWVPQFARALGAAGLAGAQHVIGIPGTLGGLVMMNGGSQRKGIGDNLLRVRGCNLEGRYFELHHRECAFHYRGSRLEQLGVVIIEADFVFVPATPAALRQEMIVNMRERRAKFPKHLPNCGSVFLSDPTMYSVIGAPGKAIEAAGLKGRRSGAAQISPLHANFIVNNGRASSADVLRLIRLARSSVYARTGYLMDCEVRYVHPSGAIVPAHVAAADDCSIGGTLG